jgi:hypothetical protein
MADALYASERHVRMERDQDTNPHADTAVDEIVNRWKVQYHLSRLRAPVSTCITAPDLRGSMLRQRAEFLREAKHMPGAPTVDDELADALVELAQTRQEAGRVQDRLRDCEEALAAERRRCSEKDVEIQRLQSQLASQAKDVEALKTDLKSATDALHLVKAPSNRARGSFTHGRTASFATTAASADVAPPPENSPMPSPPPPGRHSTTAAGHTPTAQRTSPRTTSGTPQRRSTRSPARVPPPAGSPHGATATGVSPRTQSPVRRRAFV